MEGIKKDERKNAGMITIEVVIGLVMLVGFFVLLLNFIHIIYLKQTMQAALKPTAIQLSRDYAVEESMARSGNAQTIEKLRRLLRMRERFPLTGSLQNATPDDITRSLSFNLKTLLIFEAGIQPDTSLDMWIAGGLDGISLDKSTLNPDTGELEVVVDYRIRVCNLPFLEGGGIDMPVEQRAVTKVW